MKRRTWIQAGVGGLLASTVRTQAADAAPAFRVIDTHTHFYDPTRPGGVPWPPEDSPLHRTVLPADWLAVAEPCGVRETVIVEASPLVEDNQWILDLAAQEKCIVGFVGNLDPTDAAFEANVKRFAANPLFVGVRWRSGLVDIEKEVPQILRGAQVLADHNLELDLNGSAALLPAVDRIAREVPTLRIVINHLGSAGDPRELKTEWKDGIAQVAQQPLVDMKVSALVEQVKGPAGEAPSDVGFYLPILDYLWEQFGEDRLLYGSNWPVSDRGGDYAKVFNLVHEYFAAKGPAVAAKYFSENAKRTYRWVDRSAEA